ncbi:MAG: adenylate/guanylate cyclase domain-containing protein [Dehalococcoidia bacterium]|uniref:adenylate/guanylate cyclase domain-containing protein n=1 Tax=Candidatus Amarobacter glycogenicus TaxID=3140699 RepID=UPI001D25796C|nr:adenylate/guanylate cyclase domain-containing protein [Dehalococcoidia bacterium]MBK8560784.1 adenylate/guanylate cyclase domain-containing protein [Dehalococcoidia bacterium]
MNTPTLAAEGSWELRPTGCAILFIDIAGSLRITRQLGDARAYHVLKFLSNAIRPAETNTGRVVRSLGDGVLLTFRTVDEALAHAATAQREVARCSPSDITLKIRCGIHWGNVIQADGDIFGVAVYLASRVTNHANGGEILLTDAAHEASGRGPDVFIDFGPTLLPGFDEPVRVFEYLWD